MPDEPYLPKREMSPEIELYITKEISNLKDAFQVKVDGLREASKSHVTKLAAFLALFAATVGIFTFFGLNVTVGKGIDERLKENGIAELQKRTETAAVQAEANSAAVSKYRDQIKSEITGVQDLHAQAKRNLEEQEQKFQSALTPVGTILPFAGSEIPDGWTQCDGKLLARHDHEGLFKIIAYKYGGDEKAEQFKVPDLTGRVIVGAGKSEGSKLTERNMGETGGEEKHTLTVDELASHTHRGGVVHSWSAEGSGGVLAFSGKTRATGNFDVDFDTKPEGKNVPHNVMQPFTVTNYIIKW